MQVNTVLLALLDQIDQVIGQLSPDAYRRPLPEFDGSTLGQHFRHILEFFQCLEKGWETGIVDYAARERQLLYEENPAVAAGAFSRFTLGLPGLDPYRPLLVRADIGDEPRPVYASTLGRELFFVNDHAIHHLAIIKIGLRCHFPEVQVSRTLGQSSSTIKARKPQLEQS